MIGIAVGKGYPFKRLNFVSIRGCMGRKLCALIAEKLRVNYGLGFFLLVRMNLAVVV